MHWSEWLQRSTSRLLHRPCRLPKSGPMVRSRERRDSDYPSYRVHALDTQGSLKQEISRVKCGLTVWIQEPLVVGFAPTSFGVEPRLALFARKTRQGAIQIIHDCVHVLGDRAAARIGCAHVGWKPKNVGKSSAVSSAHVRSKISRQVVRNRSEIRMRAPRRRSDDTRLRIDCLPLGKTLPFALHENPDGGPATTQRASCSIRTSWAGVTCQKSGTFHSLQIS